ncbi:MAG: precorrin-6y C5,15-methyltransferase (decarboxylating) subunit CbiE [Rhodospirillales bacterium]|nr:precorrin-6y C5,15-methyltransferase (decarboxylating) subunit CbiE [Rhodospirillales bacterium]
MIVIVGMGEDGLEGLSRQARQAIAEAQVLAGGARHFSFVPNFTGTRVDWSQGIEAGLDAIARHVKAGQSVTILASGDPLYFGVAKNVIERFGADAVRVLPVPGAVSLTCAAMGWSQPDVQVLTVHGRPLECVHLYLTPGARLVVLSEDGDTPAQMATLLTAQGFGLSRITVLERLGGAAERRIDGIARAWPPARTADLNTLALELIADADARPLSRLAGLPDNAFEHDGQLTKRAVRAVTLSSLAPLPGETLWDLGAGAGSISIEWMRAHERCRAVAVERDPARAERIATNAARLGVPRLKIRVGDSLEALDGLDGTPDAIFVGGGVSRPGLLEAAWQRLRPGGRLVVNAVTDAGALALEDFQNHHGGEKFVITIEHKAPITHFVSIKPTEQKP